MQFSWRSRAALGAASLLVGGAAVAGPLNPPAGVIQDTRISSGYKTIGEVEPRRIVGPIETPGDADSRFRIDEPGSYFLGGNVIAAAGQSAIEIAASDVTLDLNGFRVTGSAGALTLIRVTDAGAENVAIRNGTVSNQAGDGVDLSLADRCVLEDLRIKDCAGDGVAGGGLESVVRRCVATDNGGDGFGLAGLTTVDGCRSDQNGGDGFVLGPSATVRESSATSNGEIGFLMNASSDLRDCDARGNGAGGFVLGSNSTAAGCTADGNFGPGFDAAFGGSLRGCYASGNGGAGFAAVEGATFDGCSARSNASHGFDAGDRAQLTECSAEINQGFGYLLGTTCVLRGSKAVGHTTGGAGGAGIRTDVNGSVIDGNYVAGNNVGIQVLGADNVVIRNAAFNNVNTPFAFAAGNDVGTISSAAAAASAFANLSN